MTPDELDGLPPDRGGGRRRLAGATLGMAIGTTLSRLTGLGRTVALAVALGGGGFADGYNLANNTPNMVVDLVLTGVLSATFVPVFVDHLSTRRGKEAWEAISAVVTVTIVVLVAATVAFFFLTPEIIHLYTVTNHNADVQQQQQRGHLPAALVRPAVGVLRPHRPVRGPAQRPRQVRRAHVRPHRQQPGGHRRPPVVPRPGASSQPGLARRAPHRSGAPGHRHHPRRGGPGRPSAPVAARGPTCTSGSCGTRCTRPCAPSPDWPAGRSGGW